MESRNVGHLPSGEHYVRLKQGPVLFSLKDQTLHSLCLVVSFTLFISTTSYTKNNLSSQQSYEIRPQNGSGWLTGSSLSTPE